MKIYEQSGSVDYADYKIEFLYISPFDLFVQEEPFITKLDRKRKARNDVVDLFRDDSFPTPAASSDLAIPSQNIFHFSHSDVPNDVGNLNVASKSPFVMSITIGNHG